MVLGLHATPIGAEIPSALSVLLIAFGDTAGDECAKNPLHNRGFFGMNLSLAAWPLTCGTTR